MSRKVTRLIGLGALLVVGAVQGPATGGTARPGLQVLEGRRAMPEELPAGVANALDAARALTEQQPDAFGYPWVDRATDTVVVDVATPAGAAAAAGFAPRHAVRTVRFSRAQLERIKEDAIELTSADVPDGELVYLTEPDPERNRVLVTVERRSDALLRALAERYGTDAIAVRVDPSRPSPAGRNNDTSPYYGGAVIVNQNGGACSSGFSWWRTSTEAGMLTAGHCYPSGGWVYAGSASSANYMGNVTSGSRENWTAGTGTVYLTGQSTYRGDLAYVAIGTGKSSAGWIFRGGPGSTTVAPVRERWARRPIVGDKYCTGGAVAGEVCGWGVTSVGASIRYSNGEVVRPVVGGIKPGWCTRPGDSGGPVYTVRTDGGIAAKGIHSGGNHGGGDFYGDCTSFFTDIYEASAAFGGSLRLAAD